MSPEELPAVYLPLTDLFLAPNNKGMLLHPRTSQQKRNGTEKEARHEAGEKSPEREQPLIDVLIRAGFMKKEDRLVKATILRVLVANKEFSKARKYFITALQSCNG